MPSHQNSHSIIYFLSSVFVGPIFLFASFAADFTVRPEWARKLSFLVSFIGLFLCLYVILNIAPFFKILIKERAESKTRNIRPNKTNRKSLICIILSFPFFCFVSYGIFSIVSIIVGHKALNEIHKDNNTKDRYLAIIGETLSFTSAAFLLVVLLFIGPD